MDHTGCHNHPEYDDDGLDRVICREWVHGFNLASALAIAGVTRRVIMSGMG